MKVVGGLIYYLFQNKHGCRIDLWQKAEGEYKRKGQEDDVHGIPGHLQVIRITPVDIVQMDWLDFTLK